MLKAEDSISDVKRPSVRPNQQNRQAFFLQGAGGNDGSGPTILVKDIVLGLRKDGLVVGSKEVIAILIFGLGMGFQPDHFPLANQVLPFTILPLGIPPWSTEIGSDLAQW